MLHVCFFNYVYSMFLQIHEDLNQSLGSALSEVAIACVCQGTAEVCLSKKSEVDIEFHTKGLSGDLLVSG